MIRILSLEREKDKALTTAELIGNEIEALDLEFVLELKLELELLKLLLLLLMLVVLSL